MQGISWLPAGFCAAAQKSDIPLPATMLGLIGALNSNLVDQFNDGGDYHLLRTYWYDGAVDRVASQDHLIIGELPFVKVRLGNLKRGGEQRA